MSKSYTHTHTHTHARRCGFFLASNTFQNSFFFFNDDDENEIPHVDDEFIPCARVTSFSSSVLISSRSHKTNSHVQKT